MLLCESDAYVLLASAEEVLFEAECDKSVSFSSVSFSAFDVLKVVTCVVTLFEFEELSPTIRVVGITADELESVAINRRVVTV